MLKISPHCFRMVHSMCEAPDASPWRMWNMKPVRNSGCRGAEVRVHMMRDRAPSAIARTPDESAAPPEVLEYTQRILELEEEAADTAPGEERPLPPPAATVVASTVARGS